MTQQPSILSAVLTLTVVLFRWPGDLRLLILPFSVSGSLSCLIVAPTLSGSFSAALAVSRELVGKAVRGSRRSVWRAELP